MSDPDYEPFMLEAIKVIANEVRQSFALGFDKALEFHRQITQPEPNRQPISMVGAFPSEPEDDEPGTINLDSLYSLSPEGQEAVLSRYGLSWRMPEPGEVDPTHKVVEETLNSLNQESEDSK